MALICDANAQGREFGSYFFRGLASPSQTADGIASDLVLHKFFDRRDDFWRFFFDSFAAGTRFSDPLHIHIMLK